MTTKAKTPAKKPAAKKQAEPKAPTNRTVHDLLWKAGTKAHIPLTMGGKTKWVAVPKMEIQRLLDAAGMDKDPIFEVAIKGKALQFTPV